MSLTSILLFLFWCYYNSGFLSVAGYGRSTGNSIFPLVAFSLYTHILQPGTKKQIKISDGPNQNA
ncbi:MAG: hypothetical protein ABW131_14770, partial [Candidatus Sedimenticola sp. 6PFRAG5]